VTTPLVMVSYSWTDAEAAELLHEELAFRGVEVAHDRCTFPTGSRLTGAMLDAALGCDGYIVYLTPASLYEDRPDCPRPVIDDEFLPVFDRLASERPPTVMPLVHGLGHPRDEAPERVRRATGRDISSLWMPVVLDQHTDRITQPEAAQVAHLMTSEVFRRHGDELAHTESLDLSVVTRGNGQVPATVAIDGTRTLGGETPRPGEEHDWERFGHGLRDLEGSLAASTRNRALRVLARTHLTGAIAFGRTFHQAASWDLTIAGRHGDATLRSTSDDHGVIIDTDIGFRGGDVSIEIDLLGVEVSSLTGPALANAPEAVATRLLARRGPGDDLTPEQAAGAAHLISTEVRALVHDRRPANVHLFCAAPVEVAALIGHRLTSLHTTVQLYERDCNRYVPSLRLNC